jgi:hypothetical protein
MLSRVGVNWTVNGYVPALVGVPVTVHSESGSASFSPGGKEALTTFIWNADLAFRTGAGDGNRTRMTSLEGWWYSPAGCPILPL